MHARILLWLTFLMGSQSLLAQSLPRHEIAADLSPVLINFAPTYDVMYRLHGANRSLRGRVSFLGDFSISETYNFQSVGGLRNERDFTSVTTQWGWQENKFLSPIWLYAGIDIVLGWSKSRIRDNNVINIANEETLNTVVLSEFDSYTGGLTPALGATYRIGEHLGVGIELNLPLYGTLQRSKTDQWRTQKDRDGEIIEETRTQFDHRALTFTFLGAFPQQSMLSVWASVYLDGRK